jgi:DNA-binding NtrC family response regulator
MATKRTGVILVVDDHEDWCQLLSTVLTLDGHQVVTAGTFDEAKEVLKNSCFDIAVFDMRLMVDGVFGAQGMMLVVEAKKLHPSMKAIILTGFPDESQRAKALDFYHADRYLEKAPGGQTFDIDAFSQLIFDLLAETAGVEGEKAGG